MIIVNNLIKPGNNEEVNEGRKLLLSMLENAHELGIDNRNGTNDTIIINR